jgi:ATP-dependent Clp protease ATP-binding subunit ClpA
VFERFTERARQVVVLAQEEARRLGHDYIGTEHLLLGLLREQEGLAVRVLESLDVTVEEVRTQVERVVGPGDEVATGEIPFTPRAKKVLELALREALSLGHEYIGAEHILLGLVRENEGVAARILLSLDVDAETIRNELVRLLSGPKSGSGQLLEQIERIEAEKEAAIEAQDFARAAALRERARSLRSDPGDPSMMRLEQPAGRTHHGLRPAWWQLLLGWALFGISLGFGVLVGWAIWGGG